MPRIVTVAATQFACEGADLLRATATASDPDAAARWAAAVDAAREANWARMERTVRAAAAAGAQVICVQELFDFAYFCQVEQERLFALALPAEDHPLVRRAAVLARELGVVLPISFFEATPGSFFNSVAVLDADGTHLGLYRKTHIPTGPGYEEKFYFSPGDTSSGAVFSTRFGRVGVGICWDQWFPELARSLVLRGAELILYPTAIGSEPQDASLDSRDHWRTVMCGHAGANLVPVVASNRVGNEAGQVFYGSSFIADHHGAIVAELNRIDPGFVTHAVDLDAVRAQRASWGLFRDRRPELYTPLLTLDGAHIHPAAAAAVLSASRSTSADDSVVPVTAHHRHGSALGRAAAGGMRTPGRAAPSSSPSSPSSSSTSTSTSAEATATADSMRSSLHRSKTIPAVDGFVMPADFERHTCTWLAFPMRPDIWRDHAAPARIQWWGVVKTIAEFEPVRVCVDGAALEEARESLRSLGALRHPVTILEANYDDIWMRDTGPTFVVNRPSGAVRAVHWSFNAWGGEDGGCYKDFAWDAALARHLCESLAEPRSIEHRYRAPMVLEGGSVTVDGEGTVIVTESTLLNPNRNPTMTRAEIEEQLRLMLGASTVVWLESGLKHDLDTSGHVDNICQYIAPGTVALHWTDDSSHPDFEACTSADRVLRDARDSQGRPIRVVHVPSPPALAYTEDEIRGIRATDTTIARAVGQRLAASYVNFVFVNDALLVPAFGAPEDAVAVATLQAHLPHHRVLSVPAREILLGGGNLHCISCNQPAAGK